MPYQVTSIRNDHEYTSIIPRQQLAYTIIKYLAELNLTLDDFKAVVFASKLNPTHILSVDHYETLVAQHPEMAMIYESICLTNNDCMYFHTNWTVAPENWQSMTQVLAQYEIKVETLKTPERGQHIKYKTPLTHFSNAS